VTAPVGADAPDGPGLYDPCVADVDLAPRVTVVVGVDGSGRTHRLTRLAAELGVGVSHPTPATVGDLLATGDPVVVDDAHTLDAAVLTALADAARAGRAVVVARRPTLTSPELAALDDVLASRGDVELLPAAAGDAADDDTEDDTRGLPGWAGDPAAVRTRAQRRLALLPPASAQVVRVLSLDLGIGGDALAAAARIDAAELAPALRAAHDAGFTDAAERLVPAAGRAVRESLTPSEERALLDVAATAVATTGADVIAVAERLRAAGVRSPAAGSVYRAAGDRVRLADPDAALAWYDDADDADGEPVRSAAGRAEAAVLLGAPVDVPPDLTGAGPGTLAAADRERLAVAEAAAAAADGRPGRALAHLRDGGHPGAALAAALAWTAGEPAPDAGDARVHAWLHRFAEAGRAAAADPHGALPLLVEAAERLEEGTRPGPDTVPAVLPDTPHAMTAVLAVADGDSATGEALLRRAIAAGTGGPALRARHRLLRAWVRLRTGHYDAATALVREPAEDLPARERLLRTALRTGLARRSGDVAALREVWPEVQEHLARRAPDLLAVELVEELAVAAARLRRRRNADSLLDALEAAVSRLGDPPALVVPVAWARLQAAAATDDAELAAAAARTIAAAAPPGPRHAALRDAGLQWAAVLAGDVDEAAVVAAATALAQEQLPWEASRLVGQAGIRTSDPAVARRLLERARDLAGPEPQAGQPAAAPAGPAAAGLSEREVEVSRLVLAGRTHREIGAQLYIAPKTVEHHVARIRAKLGATTRAEFIASLRHLLAEPADGSGSRGE
jgi:DNA-binding CsgD family transcriptional regulator